MIIADKSTYTELDNGEIHVGRKHFDLYDVSGHEVIEREERFLSGSNYKTLVTHFHNDRTNVDWYSLWTYPKHK